MNKAVVKYGQSYAVVQKQVRIKNIEDGEVFVTPYQPVKNYKGVKR